MAGVDDGSDWRRQVMVGLLVLVTVGAVVGGIVALVTIKAADLAGIDGSAANTGLPHGPRGGGGAGGSSTPATSDSTQSTAPTGPSGSTDSSTGPTGHPSGKPLSLDASPLTVAASQRIDLTGECRSVPSGTVLQVQRREGGDWADFPVTATCNGGSYATYILTGHTGSNRLRMLALGFGATSNTVVVQVS
jgi:hypothetical protein